MTISAAIAALEALRLEHGDLPVVFHANDENAVDVVFLVRPVVFYRGAPMCVHDPDDPVEAMVRDPWRAQGRLPARNGCRSTRRTCGGLLGE